MVVVHVVYAVCHVVEHFVYPRRVGCRRIGAFVSYYVGMYVPVVAKDLIHLFSAAVILYAIFEGQAASFDDLRSCFLHVVLVFQHEFLKFVGVVGAKGAVEKKADQKHRTQVTRWFTLGGGRKVSRKIYRRAVGKSRTRRGGWYSLRVESAGY